MVHWSGITCCLGAAAFYLLSRRSGRDVEILKSVTRVYHLKDLVQLLEVESKVFPLIIVVSGRVGSETPLKCENSGILGVIIEQLVEQLFLKRDWKFSWVQDSALLQPTSKEVPWYLDLGVKHIEYVLPIGTPLTVVGEAFRDGIGNVRIRKSKQGGPFYISPIPFDQLIAKSGKWSSWFKYASIGLTVFGLVLISKDIIETILARRRRPRRNENNSDVSEDCCVIYLEEKYNTAFVPCGHMCCCIRCSSQATKRMKKCPICRKRIDKVLKIYRS